VVVATNSGVGVGAGAVGGICVGVGVAAGAPHPATNSITSAAPITGRDNFQSLISPFFRSDDLAAQ